jgi:hypothetical protein
VIWYVSSSTSLISIEPSGMISILAPVWRQVHGVIVVKPLAVSRNLQCWPYHITRPHFKIKLDALLLSFACFTWLIGLSHKNRFLPTNMKPRLLLTYCCFESLLRALRCRCCIHYSSRNRHPTSHFYTVQAVCQSWTSITWNA